MPTRLAALACCASLALVSPALAADEPARPDDSTPAAETAERGTLAALDDKHGFRDLKFGMTLKQIPGLSKPTREAGLTLYTRASDSLKLGRAALLRIRYGFKSGRLVAVLVDVMGAENSKAVLEALQAAYGPGEQENRFIESYMWNGQKVIMHFRQPPLQRNSYFVLTDRDYMVQEATKQLDEAANADL
jgi:hypothetical protein